jgi:hypothetical protein
VNGGVSSSSDSNSGTVTIEINTSEHQSGSNQQSNESSNTSESSTDNGLPPCPEEYGDDDCYIDVIWVNGNEPEPVSPEVLARQAAAQMNFRAPTIAATPTPLETTDTAIGVVGTPAWFWIADPGPETTGPNTSSVSAGGATVTATGHLAYSRWTPGDGSATITCYTTTAYDTRYGLTDSPDCGHTWAATGTFTVTVTTVIAVTWSGLGESGTFTLEFTSRATVQIGEIQSVNTLPGS